MAMTSWLVPRLSSREGKAFVASLAMRGLGDRIIALRQEASKAGMAKCELADFLERTRP
jgi:hypothetical protein